ncbi:hypothetical protein V6N13_088317 [Hibiscus sabdariffa]
MIDLGRNKLQGRIPKSLMACRMLEYLDLGNNQIRDAFPSWLGSLPELNILILSSNELYGTKGGPLSHHTVFPMLRVIDLSHNRFNGTLPSGYFERWISMASLDGKNSQAAYMVENSDMAINVMQVPSSYDGNPGLCGKPLLKECNTNSQGLPTPSSTCSEESGPLAELDWMVVPLGYGCGFLFGTVIGHVVIKKKPNWFVKTLSKTHGRRQRS